MEYFEGKNKKQIFIIAGILFLIIIIVLGVIFFTKFSKQKKLQEEKRKKAESLKVEDFLKEISNEKWQETTDKECQISQKNPEFNGFSWLGNTGSKIKKPSLFYISGKKLNIFFKNKNGKCCGSLEKFWGKLEPHLKNHEFTQNTTNSSSENYTFAFENDGLKCVYGYKDIIDGKYFCEFGIICGRENKFITQNSDFSGIFYKVNQKPPYKLMTIDKITETIYGKFVKGKTGFIFFDEVGDLFLIKKEINGVWEDKTYIIKRNPISCPLLLDEKIPPEIVEKCFDYKTNKETLYEKLYKERYK